MKQTYMKGMKTVFQIREFEQIAGSLMYYWNYRVVRAGFYKRLKITLLWHLSTSEMPLSGK